MPNEVNNVLTEKNISKKDEENIPNKIKGMKTGVSKDGTITIAGKKEAIVIKGNKGTWINSGLKTEMQPNEMVLPTEHGIYSFQLRDEALAQAKKFGIDIRDIEGLKKEIFTEFGIESLDILKQEITNNDEYKKVLKTDISNINYDLIIYVQDRLGHDMRYAIDPSKIAKDLGWYPETDFETGIRKTVKWYLENQDWVNEVASGDYQKYYERMYGNK